MIFIDDAHLERSIPVRVMVDDGAGKKERLRHYRGRWSNLTADSASELHEFTRALTRGVRIYRPQTSTKGRFRYEVNERAMQQAIERGAVITPFGTDLWRNVFTVRRTIPVGVYNGESIVLIEVKRAKRPPALVPSVPCPPLKEIGNAVTLWEWVMGAT